MTKDPKLLITNVEHLELSVRSMNSLIIHGVETLGDLVQKNESELRRWPNFGKKSLNEVKEQLAKLGLSFGMKERSVRIAEDASAWAHGKIYRLEQRVATLEEHNSILADEIMALKRSRFSAETEE